MVKADLATATPVSAESTKLSTAAPAAPSRTFAPKPNTKPEDLRAAFDDTCARYPKTLARLAE